MERPLLKLPRPLAAALDRLRAAGATCRVVGGSVRDACLGYPPKDFDVEVYGLTLERIAAELGAIGKTDLVGRSYCVVKLWLDGQEFDFSVPRRETKSGSGHRGFDVTADHAMSEREAIQRRDFTINALLYAPESDSIIDHCGGLDDLKAKLLRHLGPAFAEDPLRPLRAMQFAGRFNLTLDPETAAVCQAMRPAFRELPSERIWIEWRKWASQSIRPSSGLNALRQSGWLSGFTELNALTGIPQDPEWHPEGDVWVHTLCCVDALADNPSWQALPADTRAVLMLAVLCHDLGKATRTRFAEKGGRLRWISPGHDQAGIELSESLLRRCGAPQLYREKVKALVGGHHFLNTFSTDGPSESSMRRLARKLAPATLAELHLVMVSDHRGRPPRVSEAQEARLARFTEMATALSLEQAAPQPILKGRHLISKGWEPGPRFKRFLDEAFEAQLDGTFADESGALAWMERRLGEHDHDDRSEHQDRA